MDLQLNNKTAFISGSTQGIGFSIAHGLAKEGATIVLNGRSQQRVEQAVRRLKEKFPENDISGIAIDFGHPEEIDNYLSQLGHFDILINNIGQFEIRDFFELTTSDWRTMFEVNVMSAVRLSQHLLPKMLEQNSGRVIFINSESGVNVPGNMIHYGMSKAATAAVANGLSKLTKNTAVTVNTVIGGPTYSEGVATAVQQIANNQKISEEEMKIAIIRQTSPDSLLDRFIEPDEIASLVTFLCSPLSAAINGASVRADGGLLKVI